MSTVSLRPAHEPWSLASLDRVVSLADCVWNADRKVLFTNPDILIPEPGDLDNISKWLEFLDSEKDDANARRPEPSATGSKLAGPACTGPPF